MSLMRRAASAIALYFGISSTLPSAAPALPPAPGDAAASAPVVLKRPVRKKKRSSRQPQTVTRWIQSDLETAKHRAGAGDLSMVGRIYRWLASDGTVKGLLGTRTGGLVRLPKKFTGDDEARALLAGSEGEPGLFERACPDAELELLAADGIVVGVGIAELIDVDGLDHPVLVRLDPEFLIYRWWEDRWYYQTVNGLELVTPGDGRWVLHLPGGRQEPWNRGDWQCLGRAAISKEHAMLYRENWNGKLAHPARVAVAPRGSTEEQAQSWFKKVMAWGMNTVFGMYPGYDVKLLESNGRGYESFRETITDSNQEIMVSLAGQIVTTTGGAGFANADIHATIRGDLIEGDGKKLGNTCSDQILPHLLAGRVANPRCARVAWDTAKPTSKKEAAEAFSAAAKAITELVQALTPHGIAVDVRELAVRFAVPVKVVEQLVATVPGATIAPANDVGQPLPGATEPPDQFAPQADEPLTDEAAARLADRMTELGAEECWHGRKNHCPWCRIEVEADCERNEAGELVWSKRWVPERHARAA